MQCNIDTRGRTVRRNGGILCLILGAIALGAGFSFKSLELDVVGGCLVVAGLFQLFESRKGWCVIRAMGFKTPI